MEPVIQASAVNTNNYLAELQIVASQIAKLKLIKVQGTQTIGTNDTKITLESSSPSDPSASCSSVQSCVAANHSSTPWGRWVEYYSNCQVLADYPMGFIFDGLSKITTSFESGANVSGTNRSYMAAAWNTRGKITADLSNYKNGTSKIYLKLTKRSCEHTAYGIYTSICTSTFGGSRPTSAEENKRKRVSPGYSSMAA